jgi:F-type H+-transporting ATPase subunit delta
MSTSSFGIARHYARALLDVALREGNAEKVREELREAVGLLSDHTDLAGILGNPAIPPDRKKGIVMAVWAEGKASGLFRRLLSLLVENRRIGALESIETSFAALWNAHRNVAAAEVVSAVPLDGEQERALTAALGKATGMGVEIRSETDPSVLGGVLVRIGGKSYDGTVRSRLRALKERLASGA